jgi:hypothetical protein
VPVARRLRHCVSLARVSGLWLVVGASCWGYPQIAVNPLFAPDGALGFSLERCDWPKSAGVSRLEIRRNEDAAGPFNSAQSLCGLDTTEPGRLRPLPRWTYGEPVAGFRVIGSCLPLESGTYRIVVEGTGGGQRVFAVAGGRVTEESPRCP